MNKLMTIDDLLKFCDEQHFEKFDAHDSGYSLCISMPALFTQDDFENDLMLFANVKVFHSGLNRNQSNVTKEAMQNSISTFKYKPVLCNYQTITLEDGTEALDFTGHDIEIDENGNVRYIEKQVGCFTADTPVIKYDKKNKCDYVYAKVAIPKEYTPTAKIIDRRGGTDVSVELVVNKMSYDAKKKELLLEDIEVSGLTLLGSDRTPGMKGAKLQLEDFSINNSKIDYEKNDKLIETLEALNKTLEELNINNAERKEEKPMDKFTELLNKYEKTAEDITFNYEGLSDEELETAFAEAFAIQESNVEVKQFDDPDPTDNTDDTDDTDADDNDNTDTDTNEETEDLGLDPDEVEPGKKIVNSLSKEELFTQLFELSFNEIRQALNALCSIYRNADEWCYVADVYDDYFIMEDWDSNKFWKQSYTKDGDNITLSGERIELFAMLLTESEKLSIESMRQNYESICSQLSQYQKKELITSADYSAISDKEDFVQIASDVNSGKNEMTFEELKDYLDKALLEFAKKGSLNFEALEQKAEENKKNSVQRVGLMASGAKGNPKKSRYGNLFKR